MPNKTNLITVRKPHFNLEGLKTHWCENNFLATHFVNSMHVVFPEGEKYFIRSVKAFADQIQNPALKERVKAFIGQETQHMMQHRNFWSTLQSQSPALEVFEKIYTKMAYGESEEKRRKTVEGNKLTLSVTVALEHYTAVMAELALENNSKLLEGIPEEMVKLLQWHAAEELEHRAVAFDVLKEVDDSYYLRIIGMIYATWSLSFFVIMGQAIFMFYDKEINLFELPAQLFRFFEKTYPLLFGVLSNIADYFRPDFHPDDKDNLYLAEEIFTRMQRYSAVA